MPHVQPQLGETCGPQKLGPEHIHIRPKRVKRASVSTWSRHLQRDQGPAEARTGVSRLMGMEFPFGKTKDVPDWDGGDGRRAGSVHLMPQRCIVKMGNFISHVFYQS